MKPFTFFASLVCFVSIAALCGCSKPEPPSEPVQYVSRNTQILNAPIVSQRAYERGVSVGERISKMQRNSREREAAIIEVHGMVSALERNGFRQSAQDFAKGVHAGLKK